MKSKQYILFPLLTLIALFLCSSPAFAGGETAKTGLGQAQASGVKWQADAVLVQIITVSGNMDGTAEKLSFLFHSPQAKKSYKADVKDSKITKHLKCRRASSMRWTETLLIVFRPWPKRKRKDSREEQSQDDPPRYALRHQKRRPLLEYCQ